MCGRTTLIPSKRSTVSTRSTSPWWHSLSALMCLPTSTSVSFSTSKCLGIFSPMSFLKCYIAFFCQWLLSNVLYPIPPHTHTGCNDKSLLNWSIQCSTVFPLTQHSSPDVHSKGGLKMTKRGGGGGFGYQKGKPAHKAKIFKHVNKGKGDKRQFSR